MGYLLTPLAQELLQSEKRALRDGLDKVQPGDLNRSPVPDFASMPPAQSETAERLFERWHVALIAGDEPAAAAAVAEFGARSPDLHRRSAGNPGRRAGVAAERAQGRTPRRR